MPIGRSEVDVIDFRALVGMLLKRWLLIAMVLIAATATAVALSLRMPKIYSAQTTLYVHGGSGGSNLALQALPFVNLGDLGGGASMPYLTVLLDSNKVTDAVIDKLGLMGHPAFAADDGAPDTSEFHARVRIRRGLQQLTIIRGELRQGIITLSAETADPQLSADIANAYVAVLGGFVQTAAREHEEFVKTRLDEVRLALARAEEALKEFQTTHRTISPDREHAAELASVTSREGELESRLIAVEIGLNKAGIALRNAASPYDATQARIEIEKLEAEKRELERALRGMEIKNFEAIPETMLTLSRLIREAKIQGALYETLANQYELARISSQKEDIKFQVIDEAFAFDSPVRPRKKLNVMIGALLGLFLGVVAALALESMGDGAKPEPED